MINPVSLFSSLPAAPGIGDDTSEDAMFAKIMAREVRKSLPQEALGGEWADVFGPLLDDALARSILDDMRAAEPRSASVGAHRPVPSRVRPTMRSGEARITSDYGMRLHPTTGRHSHHDGVDIAARKGTPIEVQRAGTVVRAGDAGGYGNLVVVDHGGGVTTRYAHCDRLDVKVGQQVEAGEKLATVGSTGRSTGPHLHFEVRVKEQHVDPRNSAYSDLFPQLGTP